MINSDHYLRRELYDQVIKDTAIFEFIQAGSLDGIWYWDLTNPENEWMSDRFWETLGYDPSTKMPLASEWQKIIDPADFKTVTNNIKKHLADPHFPFDQVVRFLHNDGSIAWVRCRGIAIRDASGAPVRMLGAHTDITSFKNNEALLVKQAQELREEMNRRQESEGSVRRHNRFFDMSLDLLCLAGFDGYFSYLNDQWTACLGYSLGELRAKPFVEFVHPDDREATLKEAEKIAQGGDTVFFENRYLAKDGSYHWLSWSARAFQKDKTIYAIARDVTSQKLLQLDVQRQKDLFETVLNSIETPVFLCDVREMIIFLNTAAADYLRIPVDRSSGVLMGMLGKIFEADGAPLSDEKKPWRRAFKGEVLTGKEYRLMGPDEKSFAVMASCVPRRSSTGLVEGAVFSFSRI